MAEKAVASNPKETGNTVWFKVTSNIEIKGLMQLRHYLAKTLCSLICSANSLHDIYSFFDHYSF